MAEHVRKNIPDLIAFDASENEDFVLGAVAYLGEVMRRAAGGIWAHGPGERDPEGSLVAGVPFLIRDEGPNTVGGDPFWGIYDLVGGESDSVDTTFRRYVTHTKPGALA